MIKNIPQLVRHGLTATAILALAGCVTGPKIGQVAGDTAPRLVVNPADQSVSWDNPGAFGPVPATEAEHGAVACSGLDTDKVKFKALGYHPGALDANGAPFQGGGFYCVRK